MNALTIGLFPKNGAPPAVDTGAIFEKRPLLRAMMEQFGQCTLAELSAAMLKKLPQPDPARKQEMLSVIDGLLSARLGAKAASSAIRQLDAYYGVSTFDHHNGLNMGMSLSGNLLIASGFPLLNDPVLQQVIVLTCASVSTSNEDFARGILFNSLSPDGPVLQKLSLFPTKKYGRGATPVFRLRPYTVGEIENARKSVLERAKNGIITDAEAAIIDDVLRAVFLHESAVGASSFPAQCTIINDLFWRRIFPDPGVPGLIYLEKEEITGELLARFLLSEDTPIRRLLFDPSCDPVLQKLGLTAERFVRQGRLPTYLFWGIDPETGYRVPLSKEGDALVSENQSVRVPFMPKDVAQALQAGRLMPHFFVVYAVMHLYYGLNCFGGFNQVHYLDAMQSVYNESGIDPIKSGGDNLLYSIGMDYLFVEHAGRSLPACAMDLLLYGGGSRWEEIQAFMRSATLNDAFAANAHVIDTVLQETAMKMTQHAGHA